MPTAAFDHAALARELLRLWRGRRSQAALSRKLGFRSNVVFDWESGRRAPTAASAFGVARAVGVDVPGAIAGFYRRPVPWLESAELDSAEGVRMLIDDVRRGVSLGELASACGVSRYAVSRWIHGKAEPRFADFLRLVDVTTLRLLDFVETLAEPDRLPSVRQAWQELNLARELAYDVPWSHAVLRVLELESYQRLPRHRVGFIARELGISREEEERCLRLLLRAGQIRLQAGRWVVEETRTVDTRRDPVRSRDLRAHWCEVAAERMRADADGEFSFNLFGVSSADFDRLRQLQRAYFQQLRGIVAKSEPVEHVVLANLQLVSLEPRS